MGGRRRAVLGSRITASGGKQTAEAVVRPKTKYLEADQLPDHEPQCAQHASCLVLVGALHLQFGLVRPLRESRLTDHSPQMEPPDLSRFLS